MKLRGFTLIEILIVVVVLGILAIAVVPQFSSASERSRISSAGVVVKGIQRQLSVKHLDSGVYPTTIEAVWFEGGLLPTNPFFPDAETTFEIVNRPGAMHPTDKTNFEAGAFWYNRAHGIIRARVPQQASEAETIKLYNEVHGSRIESMSETS